MVFSREATRRDVPDRGAGVNDFTLHSAPRPARSASLIITSLAAATSSIVAGPALWREFKTPIAEATLISSHDAGASGGAGAAMVQLLARASPPASARRGGHRRYCLLPRARALHLQACFVVVVRGRRRLLRVAATGREEGAARGGIGGRRQGHGDHHLRDGGEDGGGGRGRGAGLAGAGQPAGPRDDPATLRAPRSRKSENASCP